MDLGLHDTVALVVNSHLAIATATAASLAKEGAILSLTAPDSYLMHHVELELARMSIPQDRFRAVIGDVNRTRDIHRIVRETLHRQNDIGVLVTTVQELPATRAVDLDDENIEPAIAGNFLTTVQLTREVLPHMGNSHPPRTRWPSRRHNRRLEVVTLIELNHSWHFPCKRPVGGTAVA